MNSLGVGTPYSFQSPNYDDPPQYVTHGDFKVALQQSDGSQVFNLNSTFVARAGLCQPVAGVQGEPVSFESVNYPGYYLCHGNWRLYLQQNDDSSVFAGNATFCLRDGLDAKGISFQSAIYPGYYIHIRDDGTAWVDLSDGTESFSQDATFKPIVGLAVKDIDISSIEYDLGAGTIQPQSGSQQLYVQKLENETTTPQTTSLSGTCEVTEMSSWSDSLEFRVGVTTTVETKIPFFADGRIEVSTGVTNTYTWNGSTTKTNAWEFNTPVTVPPNSTVNAVILATDATVTVPYTLTGTFNIPSGTGRPARYSGSITGTYKGSNCHEITITLRDATNQTTLSAAKPLTAALKAKAA